MTALTRPYRIEAHFERRKRNFMTRREMMLDVLLADD